jgi:hypothetical protein
VPAEVETLFRDYLAEFAPMIEAESLSADSSVYYYTSYYLHGMLSAAEALRDTALLEQTILYLDNMIAVAEDINGDGHLEWGPPEVDGSLMNAPVQLYHYQGIAPMARAAAIIRNQPEFAAYEEAAVRYVDFVHDSLIEFWHIEVYGEQIPWLPVELNGWGSYEWWSDKCSHLGTIATSLYAATGDALYLDIASRVAAGFRLKLEEEGDAWQWDIDEALIGVDGNNEGTPDTSHANREPMMMAFMHEAGVEFTDADLLRMAHTLTDLIWNGSMDDPLFANYINGGNALYRDAGPWENGQIYTGWTLVGGYYDLAQEVSKTVVTKIADGYTNASLTPMTWEPARLALAAHVLRNHARLACR